MRNILAAAMTAAFALVLATAASTSGALACDWNKTAQSKQVIADAKAEKPQQAVTTFEPAAGVKLDTKVATPDRK